jgi:uncharacterized Tic20 family protein
MQSAYDPDKRKLLNALSHGSIFFNALILAVGIPIAFLFLFEDPVVKDSAKEAINFHINMWFWLTVFGILAWVLIGLPFLGILAIVQIVMPIVAIVNSITKPDTVFRYPFILRLL